MTAKGPPRRISNIELKVVVFCSEASWAWAYHSRLSTLLGSHAVAGVAIAVYCSPYGIAFPAAPASQVLSGLLPEPPLSAPGPASLPPAPRPSTTPAVPPSYPHLFSPLSPNSICSCDCQIVRRCPAAPKDCQYSPHKGVGPDLLYQKGCKNVPTAIESSPRAQLPEAG